MRIQAVTEETFPAALGVYTASWRDSHAGICSETFLRDRDYAGYLRQRMEGLLLLTDDAPVGIIRCQDGIISDLYVMPQGMGYGKALLRFAMDRGSEFTLTVLSSNHRAIGFYAHMGFWLTDRRIFLREGLWELEMKYRETDHG